MTKIPTSSSAAAAAAATIGYCIFQFNKFDQREIDQDELLKATRALDRLAVPSTNINTDGSSLQQLVVEHHLKNLEVHGVSCLRSVLSSKMALAWDNRVSQQIDNRDPNESGCANGAFGRIHCPLVKRNQRLRERRPNPTNDLLYDDLAQVSEVYNNMSSCVNNNKKDKNKKNHSDTAAHAADRKMISRTSVRLGDIARAYFHSKGISQFQLAQMQLLQAYPGSHHQIWHRDNIQPGLTALIALRNVKSNGPTEIIMQSHHTTRSFGSFLKHILWPAGASSSTSSSEDDLDTTDRSLSLSSSLSPSTVNQRILLASIHAGDAIIYDARCLHRGRGYGKGHVDTTTPAADDTDRPVLVIRWDANQTPAPGGGIIQTALNIWNGKALSIACAVLDWLDL